MKRLSIEEEYKLFYPEYENSNIYSFKQILPYFFYNKKTQERILETLQRENRKNKDNAFDTFLKLNDQRRAFYKILTINEEEDISYQIYKGGIHLFKIYCEDKEKREIVNLYKLLDYTTFKSGKVIIGKQEFKLFKFLEKNNILSKKSIYEITSNRMTNNTYLCISRNPIDYLMCSTGQSFTSCEYLYSKTSGAYYMGLGGLVLDPNRCIIFVTKAKPNKITIRNSRFVYFRYITRSWGLWITNKHNKDKIGIVRYYPQKTIDFIDLLQRIKLKSYNIYDTKYNYTERSKLNFLLPEYINNLPATIYIDFLGLYKNKEKEYFYDCNKGKTGALTDFYWKKGFDEIKSFKDIYPERCNRCNHVLRDYDDYIHIDPEDNTKKLCHYCFERYYPTCYNCKTVTPREKVHITRDNKILCDSCFKKGVGFRCNDCRQYYFYSKFKTKVNDIVICSKCKENYIKCHICKKLKNSNQMYIHSENIVCETCYKQLPSCRKCGNAEDKLYYIFDKDKYLCKFCSRYINLRYCEKCKQYYINYCKCESLF